MDLKIKEIYANLWRSSEASLEPDEFYLDIFVENPDTTAESKTISGVVTRTLDSSRRRIFRIPDIGRLIDLQQTDSAGYLVLKELIKNNLGLEREIPGLSVYTGVSTMSVQDILSIFKKEGLAYSIRLAPELIEKCTTLIKPITKKAAAFSEYTEKPVIGLMDDFQALSEWTIWRIHTSNWPVIEKGTLLNNRERTTVPLWAS